MCPQKADARVTLISAVRLRAGAEEAHRVLHERGVAAAQRLGGLVRHELVPSIPGAQPDTVALLTFQNRADLDRWLSAQERHDVLHAMSELAESQRSLNVVGGYGGWFTTGVTLAPKKWKQAVAVVAGLIPVSVAVTSVRQGVAPNLPPLAALAINAVANVVILTWLIMPLLTRMLSGWLTK